MQSVPKTFSKTCFCQGFSSQLMRSSFFKSVRWKTKKLHHAPPSLPPLLHTNTYKDTPNSLNHIQLTLNANLSLMVSYKSLVSSSYHFLPCLQKTSHWQQHFHSTVESLQLSWVALFMPNISPSHLEFYYGSFLSRQKLLGSLTKNLFLK